MITPDTFAAGIEAAAKWHEDQRRINIVERKKAMEAGLRYSEYTDEANLHGICAEQIRNLKREHRG